MNLRTVETALSGFTLAMLLVYMPLETWASLPRGLLFNPYYHVDLIAMLLLFWGALVSLKARPEPSPYLLCAAYAWAACNGWRAMFGRIEEVMTGGELLRGAAELWFVVFGTAVALVAFVVALVLVVKATRRGRAPGEH